jgi:hypothetical protein
MPEQTNITDFDPVSGRTTTTLVSDHDRGTMDWAERQVGGKENIPMTPGSSTPPASPPTLASITPNTAAAADPAVTVTATGTGFTSGSVIRINGVDAPTSYISATSLTTPYDPTAAGSAGFTVKNADGQESGSLAFTTT